MLLLFQSQLGLNFFANETLFWSLLWPIFCAVLKKKTRFGLVNSDLKINRVSFFFWFVVQNWAHFTQNKFISQQINTIKYVSVRVNVRPQMWVYMSSHVLALSVCTRVCVCYCVCVCVCGGGGGGVCACICVRDRESDIHTEIRWHTHDCLILLNAALNLRSVALISLHLVFNSSYNLKFLGAVFLKICAQFQFLMSMRT